MRRGSRWMSVFSQIFHVSSSSNRGRATSSRAVAHHLLNGKASPSSTNWHNSLLLSRRAVKKWMRRVKDGVVEGVGIQLSADVVAISLVYFVQGVLGLSRLAVSFFLKDELKLDPAQAAIIAGFSTLPWLVKPLYGFLSDSVPLCGSHRRSYLILCGFIGATAWAALCLAVADVPSALAMILLSSLSVAMADVVVDSMVVERARGEPQSTAGSLQSLCWASSACGGIASAYWSGSLVEAYGPRFVFGITSLLPLLTTLAGCCMVERPHLQGHWHDHHSNHRPRQQQGEQGLQCQEQQPWQHQNQQHHHHQHLHELTDEPIQQAGDVEMGMVSGVHEHQPLLSQQAGRSYDVERAHALEETAGALSIRQQQQLEQEDEQDSSSALQGSAMIAVSGMDVDAVDVSSMTVREQVAYLWATIRQPGILHPTLFIFLWQISPSSESAMFFFTTNHLHFTPEFLGRVRLVTSFASLLGVAVFNFSLKHIPIRRVLLWSNIGGAALGLTQLLLVTGANRALGIDDYFFALGDSLVLTVLGQISFMPILVLAAQVCPPGIEATLFATLMSVNNGANVLGGLLGAALTRAMGITSTDFTYLPHLVIVCNVSSLFALPFLNLLPKAVQPVVEQPNSDSGCKYT